MPHCSVDQTDYLCDAAKQSFTMSKQLSVASTFSILALAALALFAPSSGAPEIDAGATIEIAAPALMVELPSFD